jgi:hypothetical protein
MELIKDTIKNVIQSWRGKKQGSPKHDPEAVLKKILTKKELGHIKFNYYKRGIFSINVDSSAWLYHLNLRKEDLLAGLRRKFSDIKDIRFFIGEIG